MTKTERNYNVIGVPACFIGINSLNDFKCFNITFRNSTVPGDPQDVKATPINSTTIKVNWKPPLAKDRNGIIRGYHIHVQETKEEVSTLAFIH